MVLGFQAALDKAIDEGESPLSAHLDLCENTNFARKYGFKGSQYTKDNQFARGVSSGTLDEPSGLDLDSIMLYSSAGFADARCANDESFGVLMKINWVNGQNVGSSKFEQQSVPSARDAAFLKRYCMITHLFVCGTCANHVFEHSIDP
jgi:hypothetical protein